MEADVAAGKLAGPVRRAPVASTEASQGSAAWSERPGEDMRTVEASRPQCSLVAPTLRPPTRFLHTTHLLHDAILDAIV
ncbi:hypothetical protein BM1_03584 [Bipolaris maydis]|nr:hypothetical protein BM1_03584 [Bipolaris maydis]